MIELVVTLAIIGFILWAIETLIPMDARIKQAIYVVVIICVAVYLLQVFGIMGKHTADIPVPQLR